MKVIYISGKAQNGKDTTAKYMAEKLTGDGYRTLITHYGDLVKYSAKQFFGWNGEKDENGRKLLQELGTDIVRADNENFWRDYLIDMLRYSKDLWDYVLVADCRFPNEIIKFTRDIDTVHVRIVRDGFKSPLTEGQQNHPSETALDSVLPNYMIHNNGTLYDLRAKAYGLAETIEKR